jgi:hypothetical protein
LHLLGQPDTFLAAKDVVLAELELEGWDEVTVGLGRIVALYYCSSTLYHVC